MFKVRPIRTCAKFEPVKESEAQIPSVELITELVKVELQELCFYVMVRVQYAPFGIADGNVHPRQNFPDTLFVIRNYGMVGGCHSVLFKSGITAEPVRGHIGVSVRPRLYLARDGGSLKIADDQHLYMPDSFGRTVLSGRRRSRPAAFGHDKDGSLALASTPSLQRTVLLVFRSFGGKEALVHFHIPMKGVKAVAPAHHIAQLMHHFPYGLVTLAAELALYLLCRYGTPGSRQQEHGRKPITHRKMAALHDRARTKLHLMFAIHASPGLMARIPAQAQTAALAAEQTVVFTETTQCSLAGGLVWVLTVKIKQGHIIYVFIVHTSRIKHKVFQYTPIGHLGGLNFANLGTCGHSYNISFTFSALNYAVENTDLYEYCLEEYDKEWKTLMKGNQVSYTELPVGDYMFRVRAASNPAAIKAVRVVVAGNTSFIRWIVVLSVAACCILIYFYSGLLGKYRTMKEYINKKTESSEENRKEKYQKSRMEEKTAMLIIGKLNECMEKDRLYLNPDLKLQDVAKVVKCNTGELSQVLNMFMNIGFTDYVNKYRIDEFIKRIQDKSASRYTLVFLSEQCGFSSRTSFFRSFKKFKGMSPAEYIKEHGIFIE